MAGMAGAASPDRWRCHRKPAAASAATNRMTPIATPALPPELSPLPPLLPPLLLLQSREVGLQGEDAKEESRELGTGRGSV